VVPEIRESLHHPCWTCRSVGDWKITRSSKYTRSDIQDLPVIRSCGTPLNMQLERVKEEVVRANGTRLSLQSGIACVEHGIRCSRLLVQSQDKKKSWNEPEVQTERNSHGLGKRKGKK
jgi:hypothetical protein